MKSSRRSFIRAAGVAAIAAPELLAATVRCPKTTAAIEGPYWRSGAPSVTNLRSGMSGQPMIIRGVVAESGSCKPIEGAVIEIWHADSHGKYDVDYGDDRRFLRTRLVTGPDGVYRFETIRPEPYAIGRNLRPAHIHYKVSAPRRTTLITQLYFSGDPYLTRDPLRAVHADLVVTPRSVRWGGETLQECVFDLKL